MGTTRHILWGTAMLWALLFAGPSSQAQNQVEFADEKLEAAVHRTLGLKVGATITAKDMLRLTTLTAISKGISDLSGLEQLVELNLRGNEVTELKPLSKLAGLKTLDLQYNSIVDISPLSRLAGLENLSLGRNQIVEIGALVRMKNLKQLQLWSNQIRDIDTLAKLTGLILLNLSGNPLSSEALEKHIPLILKNNKGLDLMINK